MNKGTGMNQLCTHVGGVGGVTASGAGAPGAVGWRKGQGQMVENLTCDALWQGHEGPHERVTTVAMEGTLRTKRPPLVGLAGERNVKVLINTMK